MADRISLRVFRPRLDGQVDLLPVGDRIAVAQVRLDLDAVFAPVFIRNVKYKRIAVAACAGGCDRKCVAAGPVAFQKECYAAAGGGASISTDSGSVQLESAENPVSHILATGTDTKLMPVW